MRNLLRSNNAPALCAGRRIKREDDAWRVRGIKRVVLFPYPVNVWLLQSVCKSSLSLKLPTAKVLLMHC